MNLPDHCLSVAGCRARRLTYRGYCAEHGPATPPLPPTQCQAPARCYCARCGQERWSLGPADTPESIRLRLDALDERRRATLTVVSPVT